MDQIRMPEGTHLAYTIYHETHWWRTLSTLNGPSAVPNDGRPCIQVSASAKGQGGGVKWEFSIVEHDLDAGKPLRLEIFDEGWEAFTLMAPFFTRLADVDTLDGVRELLDELGAVDETERTLTP
jgi:hypothetical protein